MNNSIFFYLIDDDEDDNFLFSQALSEVAPHVKLSSAYNGKEGFNALRRMEFLPDIIFMDINMPLVDGKQCLQLLKSDNRLSHIPVIIYTTSSQSKDIAEMLKKGAICFIAKPDNIDQLKNILSVVANNLSFSLRSVLQILSTNTATLIIY